jgi:stearoyl-CoA desaturase (delta-9 desaturase)
MGWLLCKKHPDVKKFGTRVSMADLEADSYIMFQHNNYLSLMFFFSVFLPVFIPWFFWNESFVASFFCAGVFRYITSLHITWLINSAAHSYGMKVKRLFLLMTRSEFNFFALFVCSHSTGKRNEFFLITA